MLTVIDSSDIDNKREREKKDNLLVLFEMGYIKYYNIKKNKSKFLNF